MGGHTVDPRRRVPSRAVRRLVLLARDGSRSAPIRRACRAALAGGALAAVARSAYPLGGVGDSSAMAR